MKNMLKYYYNIDNLKVYNKNAHIFTDGNNIYILEYVYKKEEIYNIYEIIRNKSKYFRILKNIYGDIVSNIYGNDYILVIKGKTDIDLYSEILDNNLNIISSNIKTDWVRLWSLKVDYYEYQMEHILGNYPLIDESINYYIGLAENAICYLKYNINNWNMALVLSHKRIDSDNYYNPINLMIDYRVRDVVGYLKYMFFNNNSIDISSFITKLDFSHLEYIMLMARMLFPSFYFDLYDRIINNNESENILNTVLKRVYEYEDYLRRIYIILRKKSNIPSIDWLEKGMS